MIKLTNTALIALISATLLVGCGGSDDNDVETNEVTEQVENEGTEETEGTEVNDDAVTTTTTTPPATMTPTTTTFSSNVMPILVASCQSCHGTSGDFTVTTASATWSNIQQFGAQVVHDYGNGGMGHPVGDKLTDADSATFQAWINAGAMND